LRVDGAVGEEAGDYVASVVDDDLRSGVMDEGQLLVCGTHEKKRKKIGL
jgi:hypothetical protein